MGRVKFQRGRAGGQCSINPEDFQPVVLVPAGLEAFPVKAHLQAGFFLGRIVCRLPQGGHVLQRVVLAAPAMVFPKGYTGDDAPHPFRSSSCSNWGRMLISSDFSPVLT